jgi:UDP-N-acetyl-D-mannosaminuronic acid dehydrogenase
VKPNSFDVAVVGGNGHVGLPVSLVAADSGFRVAACDINPKARGLVRSGRMPFVEYGAEPVLARTLGKTLFVPEPEEFGEAYASADTIIVTIGTPLDEYLNPRLEPVINVMSELLPHLRDGQHIMLRSTVFPGTTRRVNDYLRGAGKKIDVSFCPERIVQGYAIKELRELPHIVSGCTPEAIKRARKIFQQISGSEVYEASVVVEPEEAELTKLFLNSWRYIQFAAANEFYGITEARGLNYERIRHAMTWRYPRGESLPKPGFAAGPCLLKDTMQLAAAVPDGFLLGQAARLVNEGLPEVIIGQLGDVHGKTVAILGMAFKANIDDTRDSLSFKLKKLLEFAGARVVCSDEHATGEGWLSMGDAIGIADAVVIGAPHDRYRSLRISGPKVIDVWGVTKEAA